jgi:hypothetical protein
MDCYWVSFAGEGFGVMFNLFKGSNAVVKFVVVHLLQVLEDEVNILAHVIMNIGGQWWKVL